MRAALAYELMRIRTIRSTWWITGLALGLGMLISGLTAWGLNNDRDKLGPFASFDQLGGAVITQFAATGHVPSFVSFLLAIIGILAWGHEYRHGMVRTSLTALSSRTSLWVAKYLVAATWVAVASVLAMVLSGVVALLVAGDWLSVFNPLTWRLIGRQTAYAVLLVLVAMGFTSVTRSQVLAIVMLFLWPLVIESIVHIVFVAVPSWRQHEDVLRFLPFDAGQRLGALLGNATSTFGDPLSALGGALVFGALAAVLVGASYLLFLGRDA